MYTRDELIPFVQELATASGAVIRQYFRTGYTVENKSDDSPVTIADRKAETVMREQIMQRFPEHGIMGEEFAPHQPDADYQWVLDPIDGTKAFVSHSYLFGTLIALLHKGRPILGVINHPLLNDFLVGMAGKSWLNGKPVQIRPCRRIEDAIMLSGPYWTVFEHQNGPAFETISKRVQRHNNWGDCHGYYVVAAGGADIMADPIMNPWDLMALIPIIEGAGGVITDWQGNDAVSGNSIIATGGTIHDELIQLLNP